MQMEEKSRALTLLEKCNSVITVAKDIGVSREAIYQLKRYATSFHSLVGWYQKVSQVLAHLEKCLQKLMKF